MTLPYHHEKYAAPIPYSVDFHTRLNALVHDQKTLQNEGYKFQSFGEDEIRRMRRCRDCHVRLEKGKKGGGSAKEENAQKGDQRRQRRRQQQEKKQTHGSRPDDVEDHENGTTTTTSTSASIVVGSTITGSALSTRTTTPTATTSAPDEDRQDVASASTATATATTEQPDSNNRKKNKAVCQFHPGRVLNKHFTCCQKHVSDPGCVALDQHTAVDYAPGELEAEWKLYSTPVSVSKGGSGGGGGTPKTPNTSTPKRTAVALDCEMGVSIYGEPELVRLSLVDFFSGEILIDSLVYPHVRLQHLNTRYSGVTRAMLEEARRRRECIWGGRNAARNRVWRYVGRETIVMVHGGQGDLLALRWIHDRVIDTYIVEGGRRQVQQKQQQEEEEKKQNQNSDAADTTTTTTTTTATPATTTASATVNANAGRSLKHLAASKLGMRIQQGGHHHHHHQHRRGQNRGAPHHQGHDSVEDAMACRRLVEWYVSSEVTHST